MKRVYRSETLSVSLDDYRAFPWALAHFCMN